MRRGRHRRHRYRRSSGCRRSTQPGGLASPSQTAARAGVRSTLRRIKRSLYNLQALTHRFPVLHTQRLRCHSKREYLATTINEDQVLRLLPNVRGKTLNDHLERLRLGHVSGDGQSRICLLERVQRSGSSRTAVSQLHSPRPPSVVGRRPSGR